MGKVNALEVLKQCFGKIVPEKDARAKISPLEFVVCFIFCYLGDSKTFSLEAIRRPMKAQLNQDISRSAFWERLSRERLKNFLRDIVAELMIQLAGPALIGTHILHQLGVTGILLVDSGRPGP